MYSLRLRLSKIRRLKIICLKTKTESDKRYFDYQIKTKTKSKVSIQIPSYNSLEMIDFLKFQMTRTCLKHSINDCNSKYIRSNFFELK
jgi:hypothetical protein